MVNHLCKNCGQSFTLKYCNHCGEKHYTEKDRKLSHILHEGFHFITHFDGTFLTTLKTILTRPGMLAFDYCAGLRKKYFKPLSFFLLLVVLYLLFPMFEGLNMKLYYHIHHNFYGSFASKKVNAMMQATGMNMEQMEKLFHQKGEKVSKFLLFTIIPFMALFTRVLGFKKRRYYFDHFIFNTEVASFFILSGFLIFPLVLALGRILTGAFIVTAEWQTGVVIASAQVIFTTLAARRFFGFKYWYSILFSLLYLVMLVAFMETIYKFILFYIAFGMMA